MAFALKKQIDNINNTKKEKNSETLDILSYFFAILLGAFLYFPAFTATWITPGRMHFVADWSKHMPAFAFFPFFFIGLFFMFFCLIRRRKKADFSKTKYLFAVLAVLFCMRVGMTFFFPYSSFVYEVNYLDSSKILTLDATAIAEKFAAISAEFYLTLTVFFTFHITPSFSSLFQKWIDLILILFISVACFGIVYSLILEGKDLFSVWIRCFKTGDFSTIWEVKNTLSFFAQSNVFGFFLMLGTLASALMCFRKENILYLLFAIPLWIYCLLIFSRSPLIVMSCFLVGALLLYPISFYRTKKRASIASACILAAVLVLSGGFVLVASVDPLFKDLLHDFNETLFNPENLRARGWMTKIGLGITFSHICFFLFGTGRSEFYQLYQQVVLGTGEEVHNIHNSYPSILGEDGIFAAAFYIALVALLFYLVYRKIRKGGMKYMIFGFVLLALMVYGIVEPRLMFREEAATPLFFVLIFAPILADEGSEQGSYREKILTSSLLSNI